MKIPISALAVSLLVVGPFIPAATAQMPAAISAPGEAPILTVRAVGAQIYECRADGGGKLVWQLREPIAALIFEGKTIGRHYGGPTWELADGSAITGKVSARAPGATAKDIPLLKLEVVSRRGSGQLSGVTTIQRINTKGGMAEGPCEAEGELLGVPYLADYVFLQKGA